MKEKLKATLELIKQLTPLTFLGGAIIAIFTPIVILFCKYVSIIWGVFF